MTNSSKSTLPTSDMAAARRKNIQALRDMGIDPYPQAAFNPTHSVKALLGQKDLSQSDAQIKTVGRIIALRTVGKALFLNLYNEGSTIQVYASLKTLGDLGWKVVSFLDIGDLIGVSGFMFYTRTEELTIHAEVVTILAKGVEPIPLGKTDADGNQYQNLNDKGRLLRDRHLQMLIDDDLRKRLITRHKILKEIRRYFDDAGFVEIETPVLGRAYGGAAASPFTTHCNALSADMFMRVSPECYLKRAFVGGLHKVYEIGKQFRNEGVSYKHNPEFTSIEWYEAWTDYEFQMKRFEDLLEHLAITLHGSSFVRYRGQTLDFSAPWPRLRVLDLVAEYLQVSTDQVTKDFLSDVWGKEKFEGQKPESWGELLMAVFEERLEPDLKGPVFIIDHPVEISPLTKRHRNDDRLVERFEPFVLGMEIGNAYSELNDPDEQRKRLVEQDVSRDDPYGVDEAFLTAVDHGMPQAGGVGIGIDRIVMILTDAERLSDVILFPAL